MYSKFGMWKSFWHDRQKALLEKSLLNLSHAYLFSWPKWIGKFDVAKDFASAIMLWWSSDLHAEHLIRKNLHPDLIVLDKLWIDGIQEGVDEIYANTNVPQGYRINANPTPKSDTIWIWDIHEIIRLVNKSAESGKKVILIKNIERMNFSASNCLLKTLEEPPENTYFILTVSNADLLLPTIVSRLQTIQFNLFEPSQIESYLMWRFTDINEEMAKDIAAYSFWKISYATLFHDNSGALIDLKTDLCDIERLYENWSLLDKIRRAERLSTESEAISREIELWTYLLRNKLKNWSNSWLIWDIKALFALRDDLKHNINKKLMLENFYFWLAYGVSN